MAVCLAPTCYNSGGLFQLPACRSACVCVVQGSSQTLRCGGGSAAKNVTLCGLGPSDKLKVIAGEASTGCSWPCLELQDCLV
jgi:hypothetical protein